MQKSVSFAHQTTKARLPKMYWIATWLATRLAETDIRPHLEPQARLNLRFFF